MNVLIINGSPKGTKSNTIRLTNAFIKGMKAVKTVELKQVDIYKSNINSCKGCFSCWKVTPGKCYIEDDMTAIIENQLWADIIIWSFPLYYYNVPGGLKNMIDRQLPMALPFMAERTDSYLKVVEQAGSEYMNGGISDMTKENLNENLYQKDVFESMADASWGVEKEEDECLIFTRQMAALYNKQSYDNTTRILEMYYTDKNVTYQIELGPDGSKVYTEQFKEYTTRIETPFSVWLAISKGEMRGDEALMKQLYKVLGDFSLVINWGQYFGG